MWKQQNGYKSKNLKQLNYVDSIFPGTSIAAFMVSFFIDFHISSVMLNSSLKTSLSWCHETDMSTQNGIV